MGDVLFDCSSNRNQMRRSSQGWTAICGAVILLLNPLACVLHCTRPALAMEATPPDARFICVLHLAQSSAAAVAAGRLWLNQALWLVWRWLILLLLLPTSLLRLAMHRDIMKAMNQV